MRQPPVKGRSKYMLYPADTLRKLGKTAISMDAIGPKFLIKKLNFEYEMYTDFVGNNPKIANPEFMSDFQVKELKNSEVKRFRERKIYFLRIVRRQGEKGGENEKGFINILGKNPLLDKSYINLFTFNTIDLEKRVLCVKMEKQDGSIEMIEERNFTLKNVLGLSQV